MKFCACLRSVASLAVCAVAVGGFAEIYTPVEFIVSTGSQYADTGVRLNPKLSRIDARFILLEAAPSSSSANSPVGIAGAYYCSPNPVPDSRDETTVLTYNNRSLAISYDKEYFYPNFVRSNNQASYRCGIETTISTPTAWWVRQMGPAWCFVNQLGTKKGYNSNTDSGYYDSDKKDCWVGTCYLSTINKTAAYNDASGAITGDPYAAEGSMAKVKWYGFQISTNDVLQADLIPAQRASDSVYGFYDRVRKTFHPSVTTTPFVGPTICAWKRSSAVADPLDASHFDGDVPSSYLDVVSVPADTTIDIPSAAAITAFNTLGGLRLEDRSTTCVISNLTSGTTLYAPFYGKGVVQFLGSSSFLYLRGDSTGFEGRFTITNACIGVQWPRSFGETNCVHIYQGYKNVGSRRVDFSVGSSALYNEFHFECAYNSGQSSLIYSTTSGTDFAGPNYFPCKSQVWYGHGDVTYTWSGPIYPEGTSSSLVKFNSRGTGTNFTGADKWLGKNTFYLTISPPISCCFHATHKTFDQTKSPPCNIEVSNGKRLNLQQENVFDEDFCIRFDGGGSASGGIDMNGYDQRIGRLNLGVTNVTTYAGELFPNFTITTPTGKPATLTIREGWYLGYGKAIENYPGLFPGRLTGPVSVTLDVLPEYVAAPLRFVTTNETDGALIARRGTITLGASAKFENLTKLEATGEGLLVVETSEVGSANANGLEVVALTNRANGAAVPLTIADGCTLRTRTAVTRTTRWLHPGTYTSDNLPKFISGGGKLVVGEYGGRRGFAVLLR